MTAVTNVQENIFLSSIPGTLLHRNHLCSQKWLIFQDFFYYELGGVYLFIIFPNCTGVNESMKSSAGDAIPLPYILQPHRIQGVIGTYPGHSSLPSCPCSPCSSSPSNPDLAQHAQPGTCCGRFTPRVNWTRKLLLLYFNSTLKKTLKINKSKNFKIRTRTDFASPAALLTLCSGPRKEGTLLEPCCSQLPR